MLEDPILRFFDYLILWHEIKKESNNELSHHGSKIDLALHMNPAFCVPALCGLFFYARNSPIYLILKYMRNPALCVFALCVECFSPPNLPQSAGFMCRTYVGHYHSFLLR